MNDKIFEDWKSNHAGDYVETLPDFLRSAWDVCLQNQLDPLSPLKPHANYLDFEAVKRQAITIYAYINRVVNLVQKYFQRNTNLGLALFDENAVLIRLYGDATFCKWTTDLEISPMSDWSMDAIGANAVALGLERQEPTCTVGAQNFSRALVDTAIYFAPVGLQGGVAIILPAEDENIDYLATAAAIAFDAKIHIFMSTTLHRLYEQEQCGHLTIDKNIKTGTLSIAYNNDVIYNMFDIDIVSLNFQRVETVFDPLPKNQELWEILQEGKRITQMPVTLSVQGREGNFIISSEPYEELDLLLQGVRLFITSPSQIAVQVSSRIGHNAQFTFEKIIGKHPGFVAAKEKARRIAQSDSNILLLGESGAGKDIFAQAIHNASSRRDKPFISVNCAALPRDLIVSELFGYEGGAFTGSKKNGHLGKFELANGGTIFLDEIGDMPLDLQVMLLHVLEKKFFTRLGSTQTIRVDVKIISATNVNLLERIEQKRFRLDLYYRLSVLSITIPPLRERGDDVVLIANYLLRSICSRIKLPYEVVLSKNAEEYLKLLHWMGNVRELQNAIEGIVQIYPIKEIEPEHIRDYLGLSASSPSSPEEESVRAIASHAIQTRSGPITRDILLDALAKNNFKKGATAEYFGISRKTLYRWMNELEFDTYKLL